MYYFRTARLLSPLSGKGQLLPSSSLKFDLIIRNWKVWMEVLIFDVQLGRSSSQEETRFGVRKSFLR